MEARRALKIEARRCFARQIGARFRQREALERSFPSLTIIVRGVLGLFSIHRGAEPFSMSDVSAPAGFFNGAPRDSPCFMSEDLFTVAWSPAF